MRLAATPARLLLMLSVLLTSTAAGQSADHTTSAPVTLLDQAVAYMFDGTWQPSERTLFTYDDGHRIEAAVQAWENGAWAPQSRLYVSGAGSTHSLSSAEQWDPLLNGYVSVETTERSYVYDWATGARLPTSELIKTRVDGELVNFERTTYDINEQFDIVGSRMERWDGAGWFNVERDVLTEETAGVVQTTLLWNGSEWVFDERTTYPVATIKELYAASLAVETALTDFEGLLYGLHLMPASTTQSWEGGAWVNASRDTRYYELFTGRPMRTTYEEWSGDAWTPVSQMTYTYDADRLASTSYEVADDGGAWITVLTENYTWDEMGGLTIALQSTSEGAELQPTSRHEYAWRHTDTGTGTGTGQDGGPAVPTAFALEEAYPNPFNPSTRLTYRLSESGPVALRVYDVLGRRVATLVEGIRPAGSHEVAFDAGGLSGGLYLVRLETAHGHAVRSVTLLK